MLFSLFFKGIHYQFSTFSTELKITNINIALKFMYFYFISKQILSSFEISLKQDKTIIKGNEVKIKKIM